MSSELFKKYYFIIIILLSSSCLSQDIDTTRLRLIIKSQHINTRVEEPKIERSYNSYLSNELNIVSFLLIKTYQRYISSQDISTCNFRLSCSNFGLKVFDEYGFIKGLLITGDRLIRCNSLSRKYYRIDHVTGLAIDYPISYYSFRKNRD